MSNINRKPFTLDRIVRIIIGIIILVAIGLLVNRLGQVLLPFLIAWLIAYLMYPLLSFFQYKLKLKSRILSVVATLLTVFGILFLVGYLLLPPIIDEAQKAGFIINKFLTDPQYGWNIPPALLESIQQFLAGIDIQSQLDYQNLEGMIKTVLPKIWDMITGAGNLILNLFIVFMVLLYLIFILKDYEKISKEWIKLIPKHYRRFIRQVGEDLKIGMNKYFRGQALIALINCFLFSIGFSIIGLPLAIVLGLCAGILNIIPYMQTFAIIPGIMLAAIKAAEYNQNFFWVVVSVLAVFAVVQLIEELFLTPKIMGDVTGLNPAVILLSLSIWGSLFGVVGMILALPMTTIIISYYERFVIAGGLIDDLVSDPASTGQLEEKEEGIKKDGSTMDI
ncbi:MAG: AI-2E family transporter [Bacteroidales bacterium]|nr:AI-2E family transporter [Bacteroidales bacterium]